VTISTPARAGPTTRALFMTTPLRLTALEKSFRMPESDLQARPVYHRKRDSIEAHLTIVFPLSPSAGGSRHERAGPSGSSSRQPALKHGSLPESKTVKNRLHLDVIAADPEAEIARLVELGATRVADRDEYGYTWTLMADPEGNEFDLAKAL
jgi:hypothetical protein